jgi:hypothetical protein
MVLPDAEVRVGQVRQIHPRNVSPPADLASPFLAVKRVSRQ